MPAFRYLDELYARRDQWQDWIVDDDYRNEQGKVSADRTGQMGGLYTTLETAIERAEKNRKENAGPQSTDDKGVVKLAAFHEQQASAAKGAKQESFDACVRRIRSYLSSQKIWMTAGGVSDPHDRPPITVAYDNQIDQQEFTRVEFIGGKLCMAKDKKPIDTAKMTSFHSGPGYAIYVMSQQRNLHIHSHVIGGYHHSSLMGGAPVFGAGEVKINKGNLELLTNKSGHYQPARESLYCVLSLLQHESVPLEFAVTEYGPGGNIPFESVLAFMKHYHMDDDGGKDLQAALETLYTYVKPDAATTGSTYAGGYIPFR
jgi:hypothetical protein